MAGPQVQDALSVLGQDTLGGMGQGRPPLPIEGEKSLLCLYALTDRMPHAILRVVPLGDPIQADVRQVQPLGEQSCQGALAGTDRPNEDNVWDRPVGRGITSG